MLKKCKRETTESPKSGLGTRTQNHKKYNDHRFAQKYVDQFHRAVGRHHIIKQVTIMTKNRSLRKRVHLFCIRTG